MEISKFKKGQIIRIIDERDPAFKENNLYKVIEVQKKGYKLLSLSKNIIWKQKHANLALNVMSTKHKNMKEWIDSEYRLATEAEIVLYGRRKI